MVRFLILLAGASVCIGPALAGPSSFQRTCSDVRVELDRDTLVLSGNCRDKRGRERPVAFDLDGYHVVDGRVVFDGQGKSTFRRSCVDRDLKVSPERVQLVLECKGRQGRTTQTVELEDIHNDDGKLVRAGGAAQQAGNKSAGLNWVPGKPDNIDPRAKAVGQMADGMPVFICAGGHNGGLHPGMAGIWLEGCSIGYGGRAVLLKNHVLLATPGRWMAATPGSFFPANAISTGNEADGRPLYSCRVRQAGGPLVGKTRPEFHGCNVGDQGREQTFESYEVFVR